MIIDHDKHEAFEDLCGGPERAFGLLRLWENTHDNRTEYDRLFSKCPSKIEYRQKIFLKKALSAGYTRKQVDCFLELQ